jgi:hypothetical protein
VNEKDMPFYCVAANCTNKACLKDGISLHNIPYFNDEHAEAKRRRKVWVDFVCAKRLFVPSKTSTNAVQTPVFQLRLRPNYSS